MSGTKTSVLRSKVGLSSSKEKSKELDYYTFKTLLLKNKANVTGVFDASTANWLKIKTSAIRARTGTGSGRVGDSENLSNVFDEGRRHPTSKGTHFDPIGFVEIGAEKQFCFQAFSEPCRRK